MLTIAAGRICISVAFTSDVRNMLSGRLRISQVDDA